MKKDFKIIDTPNIFSNIPFQFIEEDTQIKQSDVSSIVNQDKNNIKDDISKSDNTDSSIELNDNVNKIASDKVDYIKNESSNDENNLEKNQPIIEMENSIIHLALKNNNGIIIFLRKGMIGTGNKADINLGDYRYISREHAKIFFENGRVFIKDNNSKNGTYVNNIKISGNALFELNEGDILKLADVEFLLVRV